MNRELKLHDYILILDGSEWHNTQALITDEIWYDGEQILVASAVGKIDRYFIFGYLRDKIKIID